MLSLIAAALLLGDQAGRPATSVRVAAEPNSRLPCDLPRALINAARARVPQLRIAGPTEQEDFAVAVTHEEGRWQLRVRRGDGELLLARELLLDRPTCGELSDSCAIVLERFFRAIEWTPIANIGASHSAVEARGANPVEIKKEDLGRLERGGSVSAPLLPGKGEAFSTRLALSAGGAFLWESSGATSLGISLEAALALQETTRLSLQLMLGRTTQIPVTIGEETRGALNVQRSLLLGKMARCGAWGVVQPCAGVAAGASIFSGSSSGRLYQQRSRVSALPAAGLFARVGYPLPMRFELSADALAALPIGSGSFTVEGTDARYSTPKVESAFSLHVGWFFF